MVCDNTNCHIQKSLSKFVLYYMQYSLEVLQVYVSWYLPPLSFNLHLILLQSADGELFSLAPDSWYWTIARKEIRFLDA